MEADRPSQAYGPGGARGVAAPLNIGQLRFFGQRLFLKTSPCVLNYFEDLNINLKSA